MDKKKPFFKQNKLIFTSLGGIGTVTKNMYVYEYGNDIVIVDCGIGFPDEAMLGIDILIPDISYLLDKKDKIRGIVVTHGHEDHFGALPYLLPVLEAPVFTTRLPAGFIKEKLKEFKLKDKFRVEVVDPSQKIKLGAFGIEFFRVNHSVPDSIGIILKTPVGNFVHAADFKFDWTPVDGKNFEVSKLAAVAGEGVLALMSDCLRVEKKGYTLSEKAVEEDFDDIFRNATGRVFITTFSSNISRIQQAINVSRNYNRRVNFVGRSLEQNTEVARRLGFLNIPKGTFLPLKEIKKLPDDKITLIVAGSQGQENSALSRIGNRDHKYIKIKRGDTIVFSADPIPGNEDKVSALKDNLARQGGTVFYSDIMEDIHVSGHASSEELKLMIGLTSPKYLIPIGGTFAQTHFYSQMAQEMGYHSSSIFLPEEGQQIEFSRNKASLGRKVETKNVMVDGLGVGDIGHIVLRDRQILADDGIVVVILPIDQSSGRIVGEVDLVSRGFVYMKESEDLIERAKKEIYRSISDLGGQISDWHFVRRKIEKNLEKFLYQETKRQPMILPVVVKV